MKNIKLNELIESALSEKEMNKILGGWTHSCGCGCIYADQGGSSTKDNFEANWKSGLHSRSGKDYSVTISGPGDKPTADTSN